MAVLERRVIEIRGVVQGVGFRPFVHALATRLHLRGFVSNRGGRVDIEVEGDHDTLEQFAREVTEAAPPLAPLESVVVRLVDAQGDSGFLIQPSRADGNPSIYIAPDAATCDACLA